MRQIIDLVEVATIEIQWKPSRYDEQLITEGEMTIVWVDVEAFDASFSRDSAYIGPGGDGGIRTRYPDFGTWLSEGNGPVEMAIAGIGGYDHVVFTNGRHRYAWMRDHGAKALPVLTWTEGAEIMQERFGTSLRRTTIRGADRLAA